MRIEEFSLRRYGPLLDSGRIKLGDFTLFFGQNEEGKTLTIDALVKLLFGKKCRLFEKIERVEESPEGFVVIRGEGDKTFKLPEKGDLTSLTGITPSQARNIFIIRNSDLSLHRENSHFREVTDRLTGMRTERIEAVKKKLREAGRLTPGGEFRSIKGEKLGERLEAAARLIEEIGELEKEVKAENYDSLEEEISALNRSENLILREMEKLELASKREKYEKGKKALDELLHSLGKLEQLEGFTPLEERSWIRHEQDLKREKERKEKLLIEEEEKKRKLVSFRQKIRQKKSEFELLETRRRKIEETIKPKISELEQGRAELEKKRRKNRFFSAAAVITLFLFSLSLAGMIIRPELRAFYLLAVLFFILSAFFSATVYFFHKERARLEELFEIIRLELAKLDIKAENLEGLLSEIQRFEDSFLVEEHKLKDLDQEFSVLSSEVKNVEEVDLPEAENRLRRAEEAIREIKERAGVKSLRGYRGKLDKLKRMETLRHSRIETLKALFGGGGENLESLISYWKGEIEALLPYREKACGTNYSMEEEGRLRERRRELAEKREEVEQKIKDFRGRLAEIEREVNAVFGTESDFLFCKTSVDLEAVRKKLEEFVSRHNLLRENVLSAIDIFDAIKREEEEKVTALFGKDSLISKYFSTITKGLYTEVQFSPEEGKVYVIPQRGEKLPGEKLSGGAYDQLYFSIRLGLGESLLAGKKGFFIMDDPFVKADRRRLVQQVNILKKICDSGWQVVYFTAKDEVKEVLEREIEEKKIHFYRMSG